MQTKTRENEQGMPTLLADLAVKAAEGKVWAEDLMDTGKRKAQRLVKKGREAGEDYLEDSTHCIKHNPWQAVGVALGAGLVLGFCGGYFFRRR
jgi:ElaB/YqjD/DUF883 family membrane-anchored ribosome-binding protein